MDRIICWLKTIKYTLVDNPWGLVNFGAYTSGHSSIEIYANDEVHITKCQQCGHVNTGFYFDPDERMQEVIKGFGDKPNE